MNLLQKVFAYLKLMLFGLRRQLDLKPDQGQALVEYGLLLALVAVVALGVMGVIADQISTIFSQFTLTL
jgi:Flp pilus assembly pilin Flp